MSGKFEKDLADFSGGNKVGEKFLGKGKGLDDDDFDALGLNEGEDTGRR